MLFIEKMIITLVLLYYLYVNEVKPYKYNHILKKSVYLFVNVLYLIVKLSKSSKSYQLQEQPFHDNKNDINITLLYLLSIYL